MSSIQWYGLSRPDPYIQYLPNQLQRGKLFYGTPSISLSLSLYPYPFIPIFLSSSLYLYQKSPKVIKVQKANCYSVSQSLSFSVKFTFIELLKQLKIVSRQAQLVRLLSQWRHTVYVFLLRFFLLLRSLLHFWVDSFWVYSFNVLSSFLMLSSLASRQ